MRIDKIVPSTRKKDCISLSLEDGTLLEITGQELTRFCLHAGDELEEPVLVALRASASQSHARAEAAALIGRRAMSRTDLKKKLREKGVGDADAEEAAGWLEAIGALNDEDYAALLVRHCAQMGYGPARWRDELRRHGIARELWEDVCAQAPDSEELAEQYLRDRFRGGAPDEKERRRAADALVRRGFAWDTVRAALRRYTDLTEEV